MRLDLADLHGCLSPSWIPAVTGGRRRPIWRWPPPARLRKWRRRSVCAAAPSCPGSDNDRRPEVLARHARPLLEQQRRLRQAMHAFARGQQGTLRLFANTSALSAFSAGQLAAWMACASWRIQIDTEERTSADIVSILAGLAQAGVVSDAVDPCRPLRLEPVAEDPPVLIVPPAHALRETAEVAFATIIHEPLVALYQTSALQQHIEEQAAGLGQALNVRIRMSHFEGLCEMVAHGAGGAILPRVIAERYQLRYRFTVITLQDHWALRRLCLCYQDDDRLSPAMRRLLEWLRQP